MEISLYEKLYSLFLCKNDECFNSPSTMEPMRSLIWRVNDYTRINEKSSEYSDSFHVNVYLLPSEPYETHMNVKMESLTA
jgi:hypothetical protein